MQETPHASRDVSATTAPAAAAHAEPTIPQGPTPHAVWPQRLAAVGLSLLLFTGTAGSAPAASLGALRTMEPSIGAPLVPATGASSGDVTLIARGPSAPVDVASTTAIAAIVVSEKNAQVPGSAAATRALPALDALKAQGWIVRPVKTLTVLSTLAPKDADAPLSRQKLGPGGFDAVVNGGFYFESNGRLHAAGPVVRDGVLEATGVAKSANRGAIAIREDGTILIGRQQGASLAALEARFGPLGALMGGGALLIEDGVKVSSSDLGRAASAGGQQFDQGALGLGAQQMRRTFHSVLAIRDGQLFVLGAPNKTGTELRDQLFAAGFDAALKLDGGSGGYFRELGSTRATGRAPLGFGIDYR